MVMSHIQEKMFYLWVRWSQLIKYSWRFSSHSVVDEINITVLPIGPTSVFKVTNDSPKSGNSFWHLECKLSSFLPLSKPCVPGPWLCCIASVKVGFLFMQEMSWESELEHFSKYLHSLSRKGGLEPTSSLFSQLHRA